MNALPDETEQLLPPERCGALIKSGARCKGDPGPNGWTCSRHEGWNDTATDEQRHQLAWLEIQEAVAARTAPAEDPDAAWLAARLAQAEALLSRLMDQERIRHRGDFGGSALEGDVADALRLCVALRLGRRALANFDTVRQAHPTGTGFGPDCRCTTCREMQAAELVPWTPDLAIGQDEAGSLVTFRAWLHQRNGHMVLDTRRAVTVPKRATALDLALIEAQAAHLAQLAKNKDVWDRQYVDLARVQATRRAAERPGWTNQKPQTKPWRPPTRKAPSGQLTAGSDTCGGG